MGVVDEELRICPEYVSGQIAIGGYSLAEGYLGDTTLTKEKFVYVEEEKNRIYLTGDNGRYVENGDIEFLGRLDNQVKINGHRIEIAEIENAIRGMQNIEDCCVVYNQSIGKGVLIAFIKNKISSISYTKEEYRKQLAFFLPPAMIATVYKGNIIKNLIMDCQSYTKYRPNETTGGIFVSWRRKEELPTGA